MLTRIEKQLKRKRDLNKIRKEKSRAKSKKKRDFSNLIKLIKKQEIQKRKQKSLDKKLIIKQKQELKLIKNIKVKENVDNNKKIQLLKNILKLKILVECGDKKFTIKHYMKLRLKTDKDFHISHNLRSRFYNAIKKEYKKSSVLRYIGCSLSELKFKLEQLFKPGMTWDNYGKWHIDHVIPLNNFDFSKESEIYKAWNFNNLQPLWEKENLTKKKSCKF